MHLIHHTLVNMLCSLCPAPLLLFSDCFVVFLLFFLGGGLCLPNFILFFGHIQFMEAFDPIFVLVHLSSAISHSKLDSAFTSSTSFRWLLLFICGGSYMLALIYVSFVFVIALYSPLRRPSHLFDLFLTICIYFCIVLFHFLSIVGKPIIFFLVLGFSNVSFFWIKSEE
jgi:hypothetical protein